MSNKTWLIVAGIFVAAGLMGCAGTRTPATPPGTAVEQQRRAQRFDPYPQTEVGPPLPGARPRDFDRNYAEPVRDKWDINGYPPVCR